MQSRGTLKDVVMTLDGHMVISFETGRITPEEIATITGKELEITAKEYRQKRSLNANSYFHVLVSKIAEKTGESITERKNSLIAEYGQPDRDISTVILLDSIDWRKVESLHLRPTTATRTLDNGKLYRVFWVMRGTHTYNTAEMSRLIDATVDQAKELGISTLPPDQIARMIATWENR